MSLEDDLLPEVATINSLILKSLEIIRHPQVDAHTKRPKTKRPKDKAGKLSLRQNVPKGQSVLWDKRNKGTKRPMGQT